MVPTLEKARKDALSSSLPSHSSSWIPMQELFMASRLWLSGSGFRLGILSGLGMVPTLEKARTLWPLSSFCSSTVSTRSTLSSPAPLSSLLASWWSLQITAAPATLELSSGIVRRRGGMGGSESRQSALVLPQPGGDLVAAPELPLLAPTHRHLALGGSDESWSLVWLLLALGTGPSSYSWVSRKEEDGRDRGEKQSCSRSCFQA